MNTRLHLRSKGLLGC
ncbi:hypothetical protein CcCBS67573_g08460 [Chytriomyces confervae]|uniref:Uncharacterized protein n=1 Tax=Chytriomyces confervae TaxID=246404 RepID=A0A507EM07_9FUNG|nr:hypothetical protein CcCBS67573_g08460 [Chytriomyces confervae]